MKRFQTMVAAAAILAATTEAGAVTCRELLALDPSMGASFVAGVTDFTLFIETKQQSTDRIREYRACIDRSGLVVFELYKAVIAYINAHPADIDRPAATAVLNTIEQVCDLPYDPKYRRDEAET